MKELIDTLTFASYRFNRETFPDITQDRWAAIFHNVAEMEALLKSETLLRACNAVAEAIRELGRKL